MKNKKILLRIKFKMLISFTLSLALFIGCLCGCKKNSESSKVLSDKNRSDFLAVTKGPSKTDSIVTPQITEKPTEAPIAEPTETPEPSYDFSDVSVGEYITLGFYEQDNDASNGKEAIEWLVLDVKDGKALVITSKGIDCIPYHKNNGCWQNYWMIEDIIVYEEPIHSVHEKVTYETSFIRHWLCNEFYYEAFGRHERNCIVKTNNNEFSDLIFILNEQEITRYFSSSEDRLCDATAYAKNKGSYIYDNGKSSWWLRNENQPSEEATFVRGNDGEVLFGTYTCVVDNVVRPCMWIDIENDCHDVPQDDFIFEDPVTTGSNIFLGRYEQDNDTSNGKEAIEWTVLTVRGSRALVISRYVIDCLLYNEDDDPVTWETCSLRTWLNENFYNDVFSSTEKSKIISSYMSDEKNKHKGTVNVGNSTYDKIFLLSIADAETYFDANIFRQCNPTSYAMSQGLLYTNSSTGNCLWWLRSHSYGQDTFFVDEDGYIIYDGTRVDCSDFGVRPAMWIDIG